MSVLDSLEQRKFYKFWQQDPVDPDHQQQITKAGETVPFQCCLRLFDCIVLDSSHDQFKQWIVANITCLKKDDGYELMAAPLSPLTYMFLSNYISHPADANPTVMETITDTSDFDTVIRAEYRHMGMSSTAMMLAALELGYDTSMVGCISQWFKDETDLKYFYQYLKDHFNYQTTYETLPALFLCIGKGIPHTRQRIYTEIGGRPGYVNDYRKQKELQYLNRPFYNKIQEQ